MSNTTVNSPTFGPKLLPPKKSILSVKHLAMHISSDQGVVKAIDDISFSINAGETLALVGESGSGKSMTALSIMRLLPTMARVNQGEVSFKGRNLLQLTEAEMRAVRGQGIGIIFQEPMTSLNPVMTIGQQIAEAVRNTPPKQSANIIQDTVVELLDVVGINNPAERMNEYPHQFSGGMRQRVMIAIALAAEPELLIADEPTTALDVTIQAQVLALLKDIQQKRNMAVLLITHDLGVVHDIADHVAVMRHGKIVETAESNAFFRAPQHPYSQGLFDAIPSLSKRGKTLSTSHTQHSVPTKTASKTVVQPLPLHSDDVLLRVRDVKTHFPIKKGVFRRTVGHVEAVNGVSLTVKKGKTLALVGESGSGKSTLAKTIIRLLEPTSGNIDFAGQALGTYRRHAKAICSELQIVFQDPYSSMNPRMLVRDILAEGMKALGTQPCHATREQRMIELLELVGLDKHSLNRYPHQFSGGQRQRISIARALAVEPQLIICDEPTSALDVSVQAQILDLLQSLQQRLGVSYLFITHDISVVSYIADDIAVMYNGRIVEQGSVEDIILRPQHEYTQTLMAAVPELYRRY